METLRIGGKRVYIWGILKRDLRDHLGMNKGNGGNECAMDIMIF